MLHKDEEAAISASDIVLVAFDGAEAIDIAGPSSVFSKAEVLRPGTYRLHIASPGGGTVVTNAGLTEPELRLTDTNEALTAGGGR